MNNQHTILPLGSAAQADNLPGRYDYIRPDQYDQPINAHISAAETRAIGMVVGCIGVGLLIVLSFVQWISCWGQRYELTSGCQLATGLFWAYTVLAVLLALAAAAVLIWSRITRVGMEVARAAITRDPYSNPVDVRQVQAWSLGAQAQRFEQRQLAEIAMAPWKMLPAGLDAYSTNSTAPKLDAPQAQAQGPEVLALIPDSEWLTWIDRMPHLLIAGRTNAGKTTLARAVLSERAKANEQLIILDPHDQPGKWTAPAIGGGRDFDSILAALSSILAEMDQRFKAYDRGQPTDKFDRLTVLIDEVPALVASTMDGNRTLDPRWQSFARKLGSEARKVRICAMLLTQSPLVQDIRINSYMRENFTRVALGDQAPTLLSEERDNKRRMALLDLLRGRTHAAAIEYNGEIHVLNTDSVPQRADQAAAIPIWAPMPAPTPAVHRPSVAMRASITPADLLSVPLPDGRTDGRTDKTQRTRLYLKAMAASGKSRDYARDRMSKLGMPFENGLWTEVRRELGLSEA